MGGFSGKRGCKSPVVDVDFRLSDSANSTDRLTTVILLEDGTIHRSDRDCATSWAPPLNGGISPVVQLTLDLERI